MEERNILVHNRGKREREREIEGEKVTIKI